MDSLLDGCIERSYLVSNEKWNEIVLNVPSESIKQIHAHSR